MRSRENLAAFFLLILLIAAGYGVIRTAGEPARHGEAHTTITNGATGVDQSALIAAQQLVRRPTTTDEVGFAEDALRIADQEMDLSFADAVREAAAHPPALTPAAQAVATRLQHAQQELAKDQAEAVSLQAAVAKAGPTEIDKLTDELNLAKAHVALHQDEVDDAHRDLITAGGDPSGRLKAMLAEHEASSKSSDSTRVKITAPPERPGLIYRALSWWQLRDKHFALAAARQLADSAGTTFSARHHAAEGTEHEAGDSAEADEHRTNVSRADAAAMLRAADQRATENQARSALDQHVDQQRELVGLYGKWLAVIEDQQRHQLNRALKAVTLILAILLAGFLLDRLIGHWLGTMAIDRRRLQTAAIVTRVAIQVIGALLILLVIFGPPNNLGTFLGLAGAGLTVALKDFIIGFFGWFVLMGNDGIRIGDLVEINGVTGEVVELGIFRTALLETGSWSDAGHPTGRRVTFNNSFAIEGHYFNFSTTGQWLWDEVRVVVPRHRDPYPIAERLKAQAEEATVEAVRGAEAHWKGARRSPRISALKPGPAVNIKPIVEGIEITLRYITHVTDRDRVRDDLYRTAMKLLGEQPGTAPVTTPNVGA